MKRDLSDLFRISCAKVTFPPHENFIISHFSTVNSALSLLLCLRSLLSIHCSRDRSLDRGYVTFIVRHRAK